MKPRIFRVNTGLRLARPFESRYAMVRRCLAANPGVPFSAIEASLAAAYPQAHSLTERLERLQREPLAPSPAADLPLSVRHRRQCPRCAAALYHSDVYLFPWLSHCPIHHCPLTESCPACHRPWPSAQEVARRDCCGCGRYAAAQVPTEDYESIAAIHEFVASDEPEHSLIARRGDRMGDPVDVWMRRITVHSRRFASCQAEQKPLFPAHRLDALHIERAPVHQRSTRLTRVVPDPVATPPHRYLAWVRHPYVRTEPRTLEEDFRVTRRIIAWIAGHTRGHPLVITDYRGLSLQYFRQAPPPCPYCLALSLWFFHVASERYAYYYERNIDDYPFCQGPGYVEFFDASEPYVLGGGDCIYRTGASFTRWFYRRGLEMLFLSLLRGIIAWCERLERYRDGKSSTVFQRELRNDPPFVDTEYMTHVVGTTLTYYYGDEHPLDAYQPPDLVAITDRCHTYNKYHQEPPLMLGPCRSTHFKHVIDRKNLTYTEFIVLHGRFHELLKKELGAGTYADRRSHRKRFRENVSK